MKKKSGTKRKKIMDDEYDPPVKIRKSAPTIPISKLENFVGYVKNVYKIDAIHLWDNRFRINVWTEETLDNYVYPKYGIAKSFFVSYEDNEIIDRTTAISIENK